MLIGNAKIGGIGSLSIKNTSYDADALNYLAAVEAADGESLENSVKVAINTFVVGCKADGSWDSIITSCIMAGARTVAGAIIPLKGNAPTNNNFVSGDYSRKIGLLGDGSTKYLATGYNNNDTTNFPQNDSHISCYISTSQANSSGTFVGTVNSTGSRFSLHHVSASGISTRNRATTLSSRFVGAPVGFQANTRNNSANYSRRFTTASEILDLTQAAESTTPSDDLLGVFANGAGSALTSARMSFYSIGKSLLISSLDTRVTTLMTTLNALL
jgi:hypothetical protein